MWRLLKRLYWSQRLRHAKQYRDNAEAILRRDIELARMDVEHCEVQVARLESERLRVHADNQLRKLTREPKQRSLFI